VRVLFWGINWPLKSTELRLRVLGRLVEEGLGMAQAQRASDDAATLGSG
jgi:hypothetical protein